MAYVKAAVIIACVIVAVCAFVFLASYLGEIIPQKTITVTITDIVYNPTTYGHSSSFQLKFSDGTWIVTTSGAIIDSLKIGHTYRLTLGHNRGGSDWIVIEAIEVAKP